jgi:hypothetical protein
MVPGRRALGAGVIGRAPGASLVGRAPGAGLVGRALALVLALGGCDGSSRGTLPAGAACTRAGEGAGGACVTSSDPRPFWDAGYCAVALIAYPRLPSNHTTEDTTASFQPAFFTAVTRAAVAIVAAWIDGGPDATSAPRP